MSRSTRWIVTLVAAWTLGLVLVPIASAQDARPVAGGLAQRSNLPGVTARRYADSFVVRHGSRLSVAGRPFRFAGANSESLGLRNYGPILSVGQHYRSERYPTRYEVDDDLATLHEMGATVVRAQTIGDTVGCALCVEPTLGHFNARAFREMDMVVAQARRYGIKLIGEFDGDANGTAPFGPPKSALDGVVSTDWYCKWRHVSLTDCPTATFEDPRILGDYERHMKAVLDHVNPYTGLAYKDDPTFAGWVDGNNLWLLNATPLPRFTSWLTKVSAYFKSIDTKQLFIDIDAAGGDYLTPGETYGYGPDLGPEPDRAVLRVPGVDVYGQEWYPKDFTALDPASPAATQLHVNARAVAGAGKVYATIEFGWDRQNYTSHHVFAQFLAGLQSDRNVSGELFWELAAHAVGHGWQPVPADRRCTPTCHGLVEDGSWWALYYTGRPTAANTASDMADRAQLLRAAAYRMAGFARVPGHEIPPAPVITATRGGDVQFEGSAGAARYTVQRRVRGHWTSPCRGCTTDNDNGWQSPFRGAACYRVIGLNLAGRAGPASTPAGAGCRGRAAATAHAQRRPAGHWVGSWSSPPVRPGALAGLVPLSAGTGGRTVRDVVRPTLSGDTLRIRLSNVFGSGPVRFTDVRVALGTSGAATRAGSSLRVHFGGATAATLAAGRQLDSDPVHMSVQAGERLVVSVYTPDPTGPATLAGSLDHTNYISDPGDRTAAAASAFPTRSTAWYWIGGVDVTSADPRAGAVVTLGDSITAGYDSTRDANRGWVDRLAVRLHADRALPPLSVLNAGIAGNNLHEGSPCYGESGLVRIGRDALDQPGVRVVVVDEGANDITQPTEPSTAPLSVCLAHQRISAAGMIALFKRSIRIIHARHLRAIGVTIAPFGRYAYWTPAIEAERQAINRWIRGSHAFDAVLDFDRAVRDPAHPSWLDPRFDSGDGLHPNDLGHAALARSISLAALIGPARSAG